VNALLDALVELIEVQVAVAVGVVPCEDLVAHFEHAPLLLAHGREEGVQQGVHPRHRDLARVLALHVHLLAPHGRELRLALHEAAGGAPAEKRAVTEPLQSR
jgi:hypothetical protein